MTNENDQIYKQKFMAFAIRMVKLKNYLNEQKHEYNIADQIQRSGTAIGANHREATFAESDSDFIHKLQIAQKECGETIYWLELLKATEYIPEELFNSLYTDAEEMQKIVRNEINGYCKRKPTPTYNLHRMMHAPEARKMINEKLRIVN